MEYNKIWWRNIIGEEVDSVLKNADNAIKAITTQKKQLELTKAKDNVVKKQRAIMDIKNGK